jgi:trypsin-like peptidase
MPHAIEASTLRILNSNGETVGTGFLVAANLVATCAHVILDAGETIDSIGGKTIKVQFTGQTKQINALVMPEHWRSVDEEDLALLEVSEVPDGAFPLRLERAEGCKLDAPLYTFGYAKAAGEDKLGGSGKFITWPTDSKVFQFRMHEAHFGHSGAPVLDVRRSVVIGIIQKGNAGRNNANGETAFAIPTEIIWRTYPKLKPLVPVIPGNDSILEGLDLLPYDYDQRIQNFLYEYLGSDQQPVPFGGRSEAIGMLDSWLESKTACLLLAAPAGRGKSALLVRWLETLKDRTDLAVAFVPVSVRFGTNMERVFHAALAARLAFLHGEDIPTSPETSTAVYRGLVSDYLSKPLSSGKTLLVVLDGLDEAADWQAGPNLIPGELPRGTKIAVSARYLAGDTDSVPWLRRLNWERKGLAAAPILAPLNRVGVADVLLKMGCPLDELSRNVDIVAELYRLSEGDPLLVSLYVGDLWAKGDTVTRLKPEDLSDIEPGYKGFFDRWWEDQKNLWGKEKPWLEQHIWYVRNLLAGALGPLFTSDMQALYPKLASNYIEDALGALQRFIIGDNKLQGYTFSHPKLEQYFWESLTPAEQRIVESYFLDWGERTLQEMIDGKRNPREKADIPTYVVRNYGAHLARADRPIEQWLPLINHQEWVQAWFSVEGAYGGYLQDVQRVWEKCRLIDQLSIKVRNRVPYLAHETRCVLIETSLHSLASNVTPDLLSSLIKTHIWTPAQGLAYIRQIPSSKQRAQSLLGIMQYLPADYFGSFITILHEIRNEVLQVVVLKKLVLWLPENLFGSIISMIKSLKSDEHKSDILVLVADRVPEIFLDTVLTVAKNISEEVDRASAIGKLAYRFPIDQQYALYVEALRLVDQFKSENDKVIVLQLFTSELVDDLLGGVLSIVRAMTVWTRVHVYALLIPRVSVQLLDEAVSCLYQSDLYSNETRKEELGRLFRLTPLQKLQDYQKSLNSRNDEFRTELLSEINQLINASIIKHSDSATIENSSDVQKRQDYGHNDSAHMERTLIEDLAKSLVINDGPFFRYFYSSISNLMPLSFTEQLLADLTISLSLKTNDAKRYVHSFVYNTGSTNTSKERLERAMREKAGEEQESLQDILLEVENLNIQVNILRELIKNTAKFNQNILSEQILSTVVLLPVFQRNYLLNEIALHRDDYDLRRVQDFLSTLDIWERGSILTTLATRLPEGELENILRMARDVPEIAGRANILKALTQRMPAERLIELLAAIKCLGDEDDRTQLVLEIVNRMPEEHLEAIYTAANECWSSANTALILINLSERYAKEPSIILEKAISIADAVTDKLNRLYILTELAHKLPEQLRSNISNEALQILLETNVNEKFAITRYENVQRKDLSNVQVLYSAILHHTSQEKVELDDMENLESLADDLILEDNLRDHWMTWSNKSYFAITSRLMDILSDSQKDMVLNSALKKAKEIGNEIYRARILCEIADKVPVTLAEEVLVLAEKIDSGWHRAQVLGMLAKCFTGERKKHILLSTFAALRNVSYQTERSELFDFLIAQSQTESKETQYYLWQEILQGFSTRKRSEFLFGLVDLLPLYLSLQENDANEIYKTVVDVATWWP